MDHGLDGRDIEGLGLRCLGRGDTLLERGEPSDEVAGFIQREDPVQGRHPGDRCGHGLDVLAGHAPAITGDIDINEVGLLLQ